MYLKKLESQHILIGFLSFILMNISAVNDDLNKSMSAKRTFIFLGSLSLILAPLLSFIGWSLPYDSIGDFFNLSISREVTDATSSLDRTNPGEVFRYYLLPHYFIYASMTFYAGAGIYLAYLSFKKMPWHALVGSVFVVVGAIYFIGVLGAFLSIPIGTVNQTNILKISFALCTLVYIGHLILGFGLLRAKLLSRWRASFVIFGVCLMTVFPGMENWMAVGSICILIGLFPLATHRELRIDTE